MADYVPPSGPPPPRDLPPGWKAQWNEQYQEWFYVNLHTKKSQWDKPTAPAVPDATHPEAPGGPPPGYSPANDSNSPNDYPADKKTAHLSTNNPYASANNGGSGGPRGSNQNLDEDAKLAAKLQAEEDARSGTDRGASDSYYQEGLQQQQQQQQQGQQGVGSYDPNQLPPREAKKGGFGGFLSKLSGKSSGSSSQQQQQYPAQQGGYGPGYGGNSPYGGGGYAPPGQGGYGQPGYGGGYPQQSGYGGYGPGPGYGGGPGYGYGGGGGGYYQQQPQRRHGGLGTAGGAALGLGGGLLGGALLADAFDGGDGGGGGYDGGDGGGDGGGGGD